MRAGVCYMPSSAHFSRQDSRVVDPFMPHQSSTGPDSKWYKSEPLCTECFHGIVPGNKCNTVHLFGCSRYNLGVVDHEQNTSTKAITHVTPIIDPGFHLLHKAVVKYTEFFSYFKIFLNVNSAYFKKFSVSEICTFYFLPLSLLVVIPCSVSKQLHFKFCAPRDL